MNNVKFGATVKTGLLAIIAVLGLGTVAPVTAAPITGTLGISGSVVVSANMVDFIPLNTGEGTFGSLEGTGYFSNIFNPIDPNDPAYVGDVIDLVGFVPVLPVPNFLHDFEERPIDLPNTYDSLSFTLLDLVDPAAAQCTGTEVAVDTVCALGFFTLRQTAEGVDISFDVTGYFVDPTFGDDGSLNTAVGLYTTQIANTTIAGITATVTNGGSIRATYSADYTATANPTIPEPATMLTFGLGTAVLAAHRRRRAKKSSQI